MKIAPIPLSSSGDSPAFHPLVDAPSGPILREPNISPDSPLWVLLVSDDNAQCLLLRDLLCPDTTLSTTKAPPDLSSFSPSIPITAVSTAAVSVALPRFAFECAADFAVGAEIVARAAYDIVLVDAGKDAQRGLDFVRAAASQNAALQNGGPQNGVPVVAPPIILLFETLDAGEVPAALVAEAALAGASSCLSKNGLSFEVLARAIGAARSRHEAPQHLQAALSQNARLESVAQSAGLGVMMARQALQADGGATALLSFVNPVFERLTGYAQSEVLGRDLAFLHGDETDADAVLAWKAALLAGEAHQSKLLCYRKDGTPFWSEWQMSPIRDARGSVTEWVGFLRSGTDQGVETESELRYSKESFVAAQKFAHFGSWTWDWNTDLNPKTAPVDAAPQVIATIQTPTANHEIPNIATQVAASGIAESAKLGATSAAAEAAASEAAATKIGVAASSEVAAAEVLTWSEETFRILGLEPHSVVPTRDLFFGLIHPDDRAKAFLLESALLTGTSLNACYRVVRPSGEVRLVQVRGVIERDAAGVPCRATGTLWDLTERQRTESRARLAKRHLQLVMQSAPIMIWALDAQGMVTFIEGRELQSLPDQAHDHVGRSIFEIYAAYPPIQLLAQQALLGEAVGEVIEIGAHFFDVRYNPLLDQSGAPCGAVGMAYDITKQRATEAALRQSQQHLHTVIDAVPMLIWAVDCEGIFILAQGRALEFVGLEPDEAVGKSIFALYGQDTPIARMVERALGGEASQEIIELPGHAFEVHYGPSRDENGTVTGAVGVSYGVTERVSAQRDLEQSEARFNRIVANASGMVYRFHRDLEKQIHFLFVSDVCQEIYGLDAEFIQAHPQALFDAVYPEDYETFFASILESERELLPWQWEGRILRADRVLRWIRCQARPARQSDGSTVWDGIVVDVTQSRSAQQEIRKGRRALDEAQQLAHIGSFEWNLESGEISWSDEMFRIFGFAPQSFTPALGALFELIVPSEREVVRGRAHTSIQSASPESMVVPITRADGEVRWLQTHTRTEVNSEGRSSLIVGSAQDVTENLTASQALRESEQRYALAAQGANDGLWDWNLISNRIYLSPRWKSMLGFAEPEIGDDPQEWLDRVHPDDGERLATLLRRHLAGETQHFECEYRLECANGEMRWMLGRALAVHGPSGAERIVGSQTDISERKIAEAQLSRNAFYDSLTGLPNRTLFLERLERTLARARRNPAYAFATLFLDIDRFKKINDSLGHLAGDQLLIEVAARFASCLRPGDTVARLGGDEFALLVDDINDEDAVPLVANRIQQALATPFVLEGKEMFITVSIGIAPYQGGEETSEDLLRNADSAMYRAKNLGRARFETFDSTLHQRARALLELETDLWRAIERNELRLHYQPLISLQSGFIHGYEALVRWNHPTRGLIPPADFIPLAEDNGLIVPLGWWVLREACRQAKAWSEARAALFAGQRTHFMSVNVSSQQFSQPDMIAQVRQIIAETGIDPQWLTLEITESVIMEHTESASVMLRSLKAMGIHLSMDDFGTGFSSLSYLHRFPLDTLKIDRAFVSQMRPSESKGQIVNTIVALAGGLGMKVVAEGVETAEQLAALRQMECGFAQGYLFSKPLPATQIQALWQGEPRW